MVRGSYYCRPCIICDQKGGHIDTFIRQYPQVFNLNVVSIMAVNEDSVNIQEVEEIEALDEFEDSRPRGLRYLLLDGICNFAMLVKNIIKHGNTLSISAEQAALAAPESYAKIRARVRMNTLIGYEYIVMNVLATIIACCGLATNSMLAIFGASAIAMLLEPVMGASLAIVEGDRKLFVQALFAEIVGMLIVLLTSFLFAIFYRYHITNLPEASLIQYATPSLLDLVMAITCGAACAYATLSRKIRVGLGGVVLSITLMPPLAACGIFLAHGSLSLAAGSMLEFLANFIGIQFTASVIFWLHGFKSDIDDHVNVAQIFKKNIVSISMIFVLAIVLSMNLKHILDRQRFEQNVKVAIRTDLAKMPGTDLADIQISRSSVVTAIVRSLTDLTQDQVKRMAADLPLKGGKQPELHVRVVRVHEVSSLDKKL